MHMLRLGRDFKYVSGLNIIAGKIIGIFNQLNKLGTAHAVEFSQIPHSVSLDLTV